MVEVLKTFTARLVDAISAIPDPTMRQNSFISKIEGMDPETAADIFHEIIEGASDHKEKYLTALDCIDVPTITKRLGNPFMSDIYDYAKRNSLQSLVSFLLRPHPVRIYQETQQNSKDTIPSGVRISLSKSNNRLQIDTLMNDSNPMVIRTLLKNPRIVESDVLQICSKTPVHEDILREVYKNKKWISRYHVKRALIFNPYTPPQIGLKLIHFMMKQDLLPIVYNAHIHSQIRNIAKQRLQSNFAGNVPDSPPDGVNVKV